MNFRIEVGKIEFLVRESRKAVSQKGINFRMQYFDFYREFRG